MKNILKLEEAGQVVLASFFYAQLHQPWWIYFVFFLAPDLGMLGYLVSTRVGAFTYNALHHKGLAAVVWMAGFFSGAIILETAGIILYAHASFDRVFGYGLKYPDSFQHTHLGMIGRGHGEAKE